MCSALLVHQFLSNTCIFYSLHSIRCFKRIMRLEASRHNLFTYWTTRCMCNLYDITSTMPHEILKETDKVLIESLCGIYCLNSRTSYSNIQGLLVTIWWWYRMRRMYRFLMLLYIYIMVPWNDVNLGISTKFITYKLYLNMN